MAVPLPMASVLLSGVVYASACEVCWSFRRGLAMDRSGVDDKVCPGEQNQVGGGNHDVA